MKQCLNRVSNYFKVPDMNEMRYCLILLAGGLLSGCSEPRTKVDDFWRAVDPIGHGRSHREHYYPHERTTGLRLPGAD